jgi:hypothetical protein
VSESDFDLVFSLKRQSRLMKLAGEALDQRTKGAQNYKRWAILMALAAATIEQQRDRLSQTTQEA